MKPDFALSLSFDGIGLHLRGDGGWLRVGDVTLDVDDLDAELADLRRAALGLAPGGFTTMLVIPESQIRYLEIETGAADDETRQAMIRHALDGATPYAVEELTFDWTVDGSVTRVAAVARETLEEAEAFALEHRFNPVSFVATPESGGFGRQVFFGETAAADLFLSAGTSVEPEDTRLEVVGAAPPPAVPAERADGTPSGGPEDRDDSAGEDAPVAPDGEEAAASSAPDAGGATAPATPGAQQDAGALADAGQTGGTSGEAATPEDATAEDEDEAADEAPPALFFSIRARRSTAASEAAEATPVLPSFRSADPARRDPPEAPVAPPLRGTGSEPPRIPQAPAPRLATPPAPVTGPRPQDREPPARPPAAGPAARRGAEKDTTGTPSAPPPIRTSGPAIAAPQPAAGQPPLSAPSHDEADRLTLFGARGDQKVGGKPRYLGLMLTAALLLFLVGVAAWAAVFVDEGLARFFPDRSERAAARLDAPEEPADPAPEVAALEAEAEDASPEPAPEPEPEAVETAARTPEAPPAQTPLPEPEPAPEARRALTPAEAEARYAVTGIWQIAPERPDLPELIPIDGLVLASIDGAVPRAEALSRPRAAPARADRTLPRQPPAPPPGTVFQLDADGNIRPTPEGSYSPRGITIYEGPPPVVPPRRDTGNAAPEAAPDTGLIFGPRLDGVAEDGPPTRPGDLSRTDEAAPAEESLLGDEAGPESALAAVRPQARPAAVTAAAQARAATFEDAQTAAEAALAEARRAAADAASASASASTATAEPASEAPDLSSATRLAVVASIAPEARPGNFGRTVARAEPEPTRIAAAAPRTVTPAAPSSTTVAREATLDNAINLRQVNLIGVYGQPSNRRALVRLSNGRYLKVEVGDRLDGGQVNAIGDAELRYTKNGRNHVLRMPSG
ncbi:hypothetical protein [Rhodosalinus sp. FB01]|uniref:hypothetical protein n=1 Tax=Rhodosalinus sp. FB01 TaxID=3239194 RepID=UPI003525408C